LEDAIRAALSGPDPNGGKDTQARALPRAGIAVVAPLAGTASVTNIIRPPAAWGRLGVGKSKFYEDYVRTGLLRSVKLGRRATGFFDDEIDALIEKMRRERDTQIVRQARRAGEQIETTSNLTPASPGAAIDE
jgi:predicted DNA-binding transcriptional regulator AlpA